MFNILEILPNNIKKPIEPLLQDKEVKTSFTDINKFVSGVVNGVDVKAAHYFYGNGWEAKEEWWRQGIRFPGWFIEEVEWNVGNSGATAIGGYIFGRFGGLMNKVCGAIAAICAIIPLILGIYYYGITSWNRYHCNKNGVWIFKNKAWGVVSMDLGSIPYWTC
jgi:hypothetical protein